MPLIPGKKNIGTNIKELHKGPKYAATLAAHGKAVADKQAVAIAKRVAGNEKPKKKPKYRMPIGR